MLNSKSFVAATTIALFISSGNGASIDSCLEQSSCLNVSIGQCTTENKRTVCLSWIPSLDCAKSNDPNESGETVSHSCPGESGTKDYDDNGSEDWLPYEQICVTVTGGDNAVFGVKDGRGCSESGTYELSGLTNDTAACIGPVNVCEGNNNKECKWTIPTEYCSPPEEQCPNDGVCNVHLPCSYEHNDLVCPCLEWRFIR